MTYIELQLQESLSSPDLMIITIIEIIPYNQQPEQKVDWWLRQQYYHHMSQLLLLGKVEYGGGPIFEVVLEC